MTPEERIAVNKLIAINGELTDKLHECRTYIKTINDSCPDLGYPALLEEIDEFLREEDHAG